MSDNCSVTPEVVQGRVNRTVTIDGYRFSYRTGPAAGEDAQPQVTPPVEIYVRLPGDPETFAS